jgi:transcriptional regulator with XRE-family HTH domain
VLTTHSSFPYPPDVAGLEPNHNTTEMPKASRENVRAVLLALGKRVKDHRLKKGWTRTTLATRANVSVATVRGLEDATKTTQPKKLERIAHALSIPVKRLEEDDTKDPRVRGWTDEDYEVANWYHHAPRQLKNRVWALQEVPNPGAALTDPQFTPLLEHWATLTQEQKNFVLNAFRYIQAHPLAESGGVDGGAAAIDPQVRSPHR